VRAFGGGEEEEDGSVELISRTEIDDSAVA
jgi:hypothetical protein